MKYKRIQPVCYCVDVNYEYNPSSDSVEYQALMDDERDVQARLSAMILALTQVRKNYGFLRKKVENDDDVLKVFLAPEFFFRGFKGGYEQDYTKLLLKRLAQFTDLKLFDNWLFFLGSTVQILETDEKGTPTLIRNMVLAREGGSGILSSNEEKIERSRVIVKESKSDTDFVYYTQFDDVVNDCVSSAYKNRGYLESSQFVGRGKERQKVNFDGAGIFDFRDITFGLEVCLDHKKQRLRQSPIAKGRTMVQVQLVPSAGMTIKENAVVAQKNGIVIHCDGAMKGVCKTDDDGNILKWETPSESSKAYHSSVATVKKEIKGSSEDAELNYLQPIKIEQVERNVMDEIMGEEKVIFRKGYGEIHYYPEIDIPDQIVSEADDPGDYWVENS